MSKNCDICGSSKHLKIDCPKSYQNKKLRPKLDNGCFICGSKKHKKGDCPYNPSNKGKDLPMDSESDY